MGVIFLGDSLHVGRYITNPIFAMLLFISDFQLIKNNFSTDTILSHKEENVQLNDMVVR